MGRLRITQKGRDVRRVAASIAAYLFIGALVAGFLWACGSLAVAGIYAFMEGMS